ncbi:hypothetical protein [Erythrobacter sp.]|uniref:hypothetical protein n=1 Tax=Erythrobacter sp. TaxID=1042 RepID=UPI001425E7E1|nr:hypothetical protein [Erythrobacter sp.]QIQ87840.1 MAG: hypothetical protein G9473_14950 [Erythrobacter sp.]
MQKLAALLLALVALVFTPGAASAQSIAPLPEGRPIIGGVRTVLVERWIEEWDPVLQRWVRVSEDSEGVAASGPIGTRLPVGWSVTETRQELAAARHARPDRRAQGWQGPRAAAPRYGPFRVIDESRAALIGSTDAATPGQFDAMLRDFPGLAVLELVEAPGTSNDIANLALGRKIRAAGLATHVPPGGSVRSGAVELFLAGERRTIAPGARFAVHSWLDQRGREADDFAADDPAHLMYIDYYVEMGMDEQRAWAFYAMTNSVPHSSALWLRAEEMRGWIAPARDKPGRMGAHRIARADQALSFAESALALPRVELDGPVSLALLDEDAIPAAPAPRILYADVTAIALARGQVELREI